MHKKYFLVLTALAAVWVFWPQLDYQLILSQEDHGRDLYSFAQVARGRHVYQDMWWIYGPFMPYYYGLFDLIFGMKISSVLLGKFVLNVAGSLIFGLAALEVMSAPLAFLAACFFIFGQQDFFYTYNHIGGIVFLLATLWFLLRYLRTGKSPDAILALGACLMTGLVKLNFGVSSLAATLLSLVLIEIFHPRRDRASRIKVLGITGFLVVPSLWAAVFYVLLHGLTVNEIQQCLPYFGQYRNNFTTPWFSLNDYGTKHWLFFLQDWIAFLDVWSPSSLTSSTLLTSMLAVFKFLLYPLLGISTVAALGLSLTKKFAEKRRDFWLVLVILAIFSLFSFHEFILSDVWYCSFWPQPFLIFGGCFLFSTALSWAPRAWRYAAGGLCLSFFILGGINEWMTVKNACRPDRFLRSPAGQIYVGNLPDWVDTFNTVTAYLQKTLRKDELFLALPCDSLFYYLTGKPAPTRQTIFFNFLRIPPEQERSVIRDLEKNRVNYVLLSNRIKCGSPQLGEFGKTYCPILYRYLKENFSEVYRYGGNWNAGAGWADNHGVILLKRNRPLPSTSSNKSLAP